ncbi:unnamed protein product [Prorocentrum cordatum]|uniref:Uncharacterized protein n=1 Tax=Prorocentrum cordatum TaxID=2364126 RepID=A0ABN9W7S2_9DINO|nr:unnamed protein product [Polarella glacialis]
MGSCRAQRAPGSVTCAEKRGRSGIRAEARPSQAVALCRVRPTWAGSRSRARSPSASTWPAAGKLDILDLEDIRRSVIFLQQRGMPRGTNRHVDSTSTGDH